MVTTKSDSRNHRAARRPRRVGCGARSSHRRPSRRPVIGRGGQVFFSGSIAQHMEGTRTLDWLAGAAMLLAAASWGALASLLGS